MPEDFESLTFPPGCWTTSNATYVQRSTASGYGVGGGSASFNNWTQTSGTVGNLISPTLPAVGSGYSLVFDYAYSYYPSGTTNDSLVIQYSSDGGSTWSNLGAYGGGATNPLNTGPVGGSSSQFFPTSTQWGTLYLAIPAGANRVRFHGFSNFGNMMYVDNVHLELGGPMTITAITVTHPTLADAAPTTDAQILKVAVTTTGTVGPITVSALRTQVGDMIATSYSYVSSAKMYYTTTNAFSTSNLYATDGGSVDSNSDEFSGAQTLSQGNNFFWMVYHVSSNAKCVDLDASLVEFETDDAQGLKDSTFFGTPWSPVGVRHVSAVTALVPADGFTSTCSNPTFSWTRSGGYTGNYDFVLDGNAPFTTPDTFVITSNLPAGPHTWSVSATTNTCPYEVRNFTVVNDPEVCYTNASTNACDNDDITSVRICGLLTTTTPQYTAGTPCNPGYTDLTDSVPNQVYTFEQCGVCTMTVGTAGPVGTAWSEGTKMWIDFNDNGSFEDVGELLFAPTAQTAVVYPNHVTTGTITIPTTATLGTHRMRIRCSFATTSFTSTVGGSTFGETEDYTINIVPSTQPLPDFNGNVAVITGASSGCLSQATTICLQGGGSVSGQISWAFSTTSGGPYTTITGVDSMCAIIAANTPGTYYLVAQLTGSCPPVIITSNEVVLTVSSTVAYDTPCNNTCGDNTVTCGTNGNIIYSNIGATVDPGEPFAPGGNCGGNMSWCGSELTHSVWFKYTYCLIIENL